MRIPGSWKSGQKWLRLLKFTYWNHACWAISMSSSARLNEIHLRQWTVLLRECVVIIEVTFFIGFQLTHWNVPVTMQKLGSIMEKKLRPLLHSVKSHVNRGGENPVLVLKDQKLVTSKLSLSFYPETIKKKKNVANNPHYVWIKCF